MDQELATLLFVGIASTAILILGIRERRNHRSNLEQIELRVSVNGIRGKSTATRMITAVLASSGLRTVGKTTGTAPRLIRPDGSELPIHRKPQGPNISEQQEVVREALKMKADALVCECMAVNPDYQTVFQDEYIRANLGVIVNVLEDHMDVMGPTTKEIADAFTSTIPYDGKLVIAPGPYESFFRSVADHRNTEVFLAPVEEVTDEMLSRFNYLVFPENVALALAVGDAFGIPRDKAFEAMLKANPDPGAGAVYEYCDGVNSATFVNAFAVNDAESTVKMVERVVKEERSVKPPVYLMNCRPDRVDRTRQFAKDVLPILPPGIVITVGNITSPIVRAIKKGQIDTLEFLDLESATAEQILEVIDDRLDGQLIIGMGNIHGVAEELLPLLTNSVEPQENIGSHVR